MKNLCYYKQVPTRTEYLGEFPSGQRGQTVNLLLIASVVRIHLPPPNERNPNFFPVGDGFGFFVSIEEIMEW